MKLPFRPFDPLPPDGRLRIGAADKSPGPSDDDFFQKVEKTNGSSQTGISPGVQEVTV